MHFWVSWNVLNAELASRSAPVHMPFGTPLGAIRRSGTAGIPRPVYLRVVMPMLSVGALSVDFTLAAGR